MLPVLCKSDQSSLELIVWNVILEHSIVGDADLWSISCDYCIG